VLAVHDPMPTFAAPVRLWRQAMPVIGAHTVAAPDGGRGIHRRSNANGVPRPKELPGDSRCALAHALMHPGGKGLAPYLPGLQQLRNFHPEKRVDSLAELREYVGSASSLKRIIGAVPLCGPLKYLAIAYPSQSPDCLPGRLVIVPPGSVRAKTASMFSMTQA
jgi:hypothetical protein